ncbi:hypothetical protein [Streptomyces hokutonensis]|uniref:hypothetical protein n=1 Tax=Streptomyces hokutonensis TaxID=1306990 RepID=UPI0036B18DFD
MAVTKMTAVPRSLIWVIVVVLAAVVATALSMKSEHKTAEGAFVSGEFTIAGCLIIAAGIGDLLCWMPGQEMTTPLMFLFLGCIGSLAISGIAYWIVTSNEGHPVTSEHYVWAIGSFVLAATAGTAAAYRVARG